MTDNELLLESRAFGFASAETAPAHFRERIISLRRAFIRKENAPAPTREYIAGCEQRTAVAAAALRTVTRLFPTKVTRPAVAPKSQDAVLRSIAHRLAAEIRNDAKVLSRARLDAEAKREADELAEQVALFNAEVWPWGA